MPDPSPAHADGGDLAALQRLNDEFICAVASSDAAWFDRHLSDDFLNSNADGTLAERSAFLRQVARPLPVRDLACEDVRIRLFGSAAIVHGRTTYTKPDGQRGHGRYTDVWAREAGHWRCTAADVTRC